MRKRMFAMLLACLMLSGCGGSGDDTSTPGGASSQPSVSQQGGSPSKPSGGKAENVPDVSPPAGGEQQGFQRNEIQELAGNQGAMIAVAYLGYVELPSFSDVSVYLEATGLGEEYPFLMEITEDRVVRLEGEEWYAVMPVDDSITLTVSEYVTDGQDDYVPDKGEELLAVEDGLPLLVCGNISDIVPNILIEARNSQGQLLEYSPCLSLMDGSLSWAEGAYDFTPYALLGMEYNPLADSVCCGTWYTQSKDGEGNRMALTLTLDGSGWAEYSYGPPYSDLYEKFEGSWSLDEQNRMVLELYGGPVSWDGSIASGDQYETTCVFVWDYMSRHLVLEHTDGGSLLYNTEGGWFDFMPFDVYRLNGSWTADSQYQDTCYELELMENGESRLQLYNEDAVMVVYGGGWTLDEDYLSLSLQRESGQHPEDPDLDYLMGTYYVERGQNTMLLHYEDGMILTPDMEEDGSEEFYLKPPVTVDYAHNVLYNYYGYDEFVADSTQPAVEAVFMAGEYVSDFKVLSLFCQDVDLEGNMQFDVTELYRQDTMDPERPLVVTLTFYGDLPSYGISYVDETGAERSFYLSLSGENGGLVLTEF